MVCCEVGPRLDEERRENRVPQSVDVERLVVGFEEDLQTSHGVHLHFEVAVLVLLLLVLLRKATLAAGVARAAFHRRLVVRGVSLGSVNNHHDFALLRRMTSAVLGRAIGCGVHLDENFLRLVCGLRGSHSDLENFLGELGAKEDELVELEEENDRIAVGQLELFVLDCGFHHMLQGSDHCRDHDDRPSRPECEPNVSHVEHEQVLDFRERRL